MASYTMEGKGREEALSAGKEKEAGVGGVGQEVGVGHEVGVGQEIRVAQEAGAREGKAA